MAKLQSNQRNRLPDSAFAYVDTAGRRRLPIHDAAHVKNALARFNQVRFESEAAREKARARLLRAAKKFGIVPVGFIKSQIEAERRKARADLDDQTRFKARALPAADLPRGFVTLLMTDVENSTALLRKLGDDYRDLLNDLRRLLREATERAGGREIDARADEFFAVFEHAPAAVRAAADMQRDVARQAWPEQLDVRVRIGLHSGRPTLTDVGYIGIAVHTAARVCSIARGGQILVSGDTAAAADGKADFGFRSLGRRRLRGLPAAVPLFQVLADGLPAEFPPLRATRRR